MPRMFSTLSLRRHDNTGRTDHDPAGGNRSGPSPKTLSSLFQGGVRITGAGVVRISRGFNRSISASLSASCCFSTSISSRS